MATKKAAATKKTARPAEPKSTRDTVVDKAVDNVNKAVDDVQERTEDAMETALRFTRDATYVTIGAGFVVQERISNRDFEVVDYRTFIDTFIDDAKAKGHERAVDFQHFVEPYTKRVTDVVDPITERFEARLPEQVRTTLQDNRTRVRELLSA